MKSCVICYKEFDIDSRNGLKKTCSTECALHLRRNRARISQEIKRKDPAFRQKQILYLRQYQEKNRDTLNEQRRNQYATDLDFRTQRKQSANAWARKNPERKRENERRWQKLNFDKITSRNHRNRTSWDLDPALIKAIYEYYHYTCVYCGKYGGKLSIEHILPIKRGGTDDFENLAIACRNCNPRKGKKTILEYALYLQETL